MRLSGLALLAALTLTACGGGGQPNVDRPISSTSTPATTTTSTKPSSGDIAACKAYLRVEKVVNLNLKDLRLPMGVVEDLFKEWADDLETGAGTATKPTLVASIKGTVAGLRSTAATVASDPKAWGDGTTDLIPDLRVVYEESQKVTDDCRMADPTGDYVAIVNAA